MARGVGGECSHLITGGCRQPLHFPGSLLQHVQGWFPAAVESGHVHRHLRLPRPLGARVGVWSEPGPPRTPRCPALPPGRPTPPPEAALPDQYRGRVQVSPSESHSAISLGTRWPRRKPTASRESRGLETELAISGPPQVLTIWGTVGFRGDHACRPPTPPPPPPSPLRPRFEGDAWPSR